ncbi:MAG: 4Fe-4S binding protein [Deltaproteobacteria bacterium]|nr:4Fe-4S binding protein [Deltaproteobacteria bacterium]
MARPSSRYSKPRALVLLFVHLLIAAHITHFLISGRTLAPLELNESLHTIHGGVLTAGFLLLVLSLLSTLLFGRFFCGWGCHLIAIQDASTWILGRLGIPARPFRSRALTLVPLGFLGYLFVWPQLTRVLAGGEHPGLRIVESGQGWSSFSTNDFFRNLPPLDVAVSTLVACGFLTVLILGNRGFCRLACPYGALFALIDRFALRRIVLDGDCSGCGKCTAACNSDVRVHEELVRHGRVIDSGCLKDLDCVSACPTKAIRLGRSSPALRHGPALIQSLVQVGVRRSAELSLAEELLTGLAFLAAFLATRGLYDLVPITLALGLGVMTGWAASLVFRLATKPRVDFRKLRLKRATGLTRLGKGLGVFVALWFSFVAHSAWVRFHDFEADRLIRSMTRANRRSTLGAAAEHLELTLEHGLVRPTSSLKKLASAYAALGRSQEAAVILREILIRNPSDEEAARRLRTSTGVAHE